MKLFSTLFFSLFCTTLCATSFDPNYRFNHKINVVTGIDTSDIKVKKYGGFPMAQRAVLYGDLDKLIVILYRFQDHEWEGWRASSNMQGYMLHQEILIKKKKYFIVSLDTPEQVKSLEYALANPAD
jgi:hypothetical protein